MTTYKPGPNNQVVLILEGPSAGYVGRTTGEMRQGRYVQVICEDRVAWPRVDDVQVVGEVEPGPPMLAVTSVRERVRAVRIDPLEQPRRVMDERYAARYQRAQDIRRRIAQGAGMPDIAAEFGVSQQYVSLVVDGAILFSPDRHQPEPVGVEERAA